MEAIYKHDLYGQVTDVKLDFAQYRNNGTLDLQLYSRPDVDEMEFADAENAYCVPYATVTVNLPESACLPVNVQFIIDMIESSGLKPAEKNDRGELYHLHLTGHPDLEVIIYKGTDPEHVRRNLVSGMLDLAAQYPRVGYTPNHALAPERIS